LRELGQDEVRFPFCILERGPPDLLAISLDVVGDDVTPVASFVDGVGDDNAVVVAGKFQAEPGFRFFRNLLRRR
jgi:hypothetical protein